MHTITLDLTPEQMDRLQAAASSAEKTPEQFIHDAALRRAREVLSFGCSSPAPGTPGPDDQDWSSAEDAVYDESAEKA